MKPQPAVLKMVDSLFVDRENELQYAQANLWSPATAQKRIYYVTGAGAIGKSWLLYRYYQEATRHGCLGIWIDFSRAAFDNYLAVLRDIQHTLGQPFERFQQRTEENLRIYLPEVHTGAGDAGEGIHIGNGARVREVEIDGEIAGRDINTFYLEIGDLTILQQSHAVTSLTEAFLDDLSNFLGDRKTIFLFDDIGSSAERGIEGLNSRTCQWLIEEFVLPLHDRLPQTAFVLTQTGGTGPDTLLFYAKKHTLTEFEGDQQQIYTIYRTYLEKMGLDANQVDDGLLNKLHAQVQGNPAKLFAVAGDL
ncbi:MAG: hypothetical protein JW726_05140 [Anaerolineales bacterium]|nr:hypothetical protein [Anaerolineales bacterium]